MKIDYEYLCVLRQNNPAWKLLRADMAPLVIDFLNRVFIEANRRVITEPDLIERLEDELYFLREIYGDSAFPRIAADYLYDWSEPDRGWLRRFYPANGDEPCYDLTPSAEKAIAWISSLAQNSFVGTESRLKLIFELLRQISQGTEADPELRVADLKRRRAEIEDEIARVERGEAGMLDSAGVKDRFQQFSQMARELLSDFREVEYNFRALDRDVRRKIALSTEGKGAILDDVLGKSDSIEESDQGKSFNAFYDFLLSPSKRMELNSLLEKTFQMEAVLETNYDERLTRIADSWLEAGDHTLSVMRQLSAQLRQFLDGRVWLENRRITEILQEISRKALDIESPPDGDFMYVDLPGVEIELMMERPLFIPTLRNIINSENIVLADEAEDDGALFDQFFVDRAELAENIRRTLIGRSQTTLEEVAAKFPIRRGLAELVTYLSIAADSPSAFFDYGAEDMILWTADGGERKRARLPRVIFVKDALRMGA